MEQVAEDEIKKLIQQDIIEPVKEYAEFQSSVVIVPKRDGTSRFGVDMREVNKRIGKDSHPFLTWERLAAKLDGSKWYSKLDLKQAFYHVKLDEASKTVTTFSTHIGLFRFKRLVFGMSATSEIFQRIFEELMRDIPGLVIYIDDILTF